MKYVAFAIDNDNDLHANAKFLRQMDTLRAMDKLKAPVTLTIGSYLGKLERSYVMDYDDFTSYVQDAGYVDKQDCFLIIEYGHRNVPYTFLRYADGRTSPAGILKEVSAEEAMKAVGYTYRPDADAYFVMEPIE